MEHNDYEYVDLGLSVKWATCNVGANSPEEYGDYFAWGEVDPKCEYTLTNYAVYDNDLDRINGKVQYDAARKTLGNSWRMPTVAEWEELLDERNCTWHWVKQNGVAGYKVESKHNGCSIFLPAVGWRMGSVLFAWTEYGGYWSAMRYEEDKDMAYYLYFDDSGSCHISWAYCYVGRTIRPVCE